MKFVLGFILMLLPMVSAAHGRLYTCDIVDQTREEAGSPLDGLSVHLDSYEINFLRQVPQPDGSTKASSEVLIDEKTVGKPQFPRENCRIKQIYSKKTEKGFFSFDCAMLDSSEISTIGHIDFSYSIREGTGSYNELASIPDSTKKWSLKNCVLESAGR